MRGERREKHSADVLLGFSCSKHELRACRSQRTKNISADGWKFTFTNQPGDDAMGRNESRRTIPRKWRAFVVKINRKRRRDENLFGRERGK